MELRKINNRIYYLPFSEETDRPVLGYIKGDKYSLMVDAGNSAKHVDLFNREIQRCGLTAPDFIAITHWHWDHTFGMHAATGKIIASRLTNEELIKVSKWEWSEETMQLRLQTGEDIEFCDRCIRLEYPDRNLITVRTADIIFENELILDLGGIHCELKRFGGPHSEDSVIAYIPEERVAFLGDAISGDYYHNEGRYDKLKLENLFVELSVLEADTFISGHDDPEAKEDVLDYLKEEIDVL